MNGGILPQAVGPVPMPYGLPPGPTAQPAPFWRTANAIAGPNVSFAQVTSGASATTKGAWTQQFASLSSTISFLYLSVQTNSSTLSLNVLVDVGVGAAGAEQVVVSNLAVGGLGIQHIGIPLRVNAGSRLSLRISADRTSTAFNIFATATSRYPDVESQMPTAVDVLGTSDATNTGTALSGASGSWCQIVAGTQKHYQCMALIPSLTGQPSGGGFTFELGYGASDSPQVVGSMRIQTNFAQFSISNFYPHHFGVLGPAVPAGTRLAVRHNIASNPERYGVCLLGIPYV
jgi:hypothetical protein